MILHDNFETGINPGKTAQAHHMHPQKFESMIKDAGLDLNIHDPKHLRWWSSTTHQKYANQVNMEFEKGFEILQMNGKLTEDNVIKLGNSITEKYINK